jgi:hypothetical protein
MTTLNAGPPKRRVSKIPVDWSPRRSGRLAAKSKFRVANPVVQAQNVLIKRWEIQPQELGVDHEAMHSYHQVFADNVSTSKRKEIRAVFMDSEDVAAACPPDS